MRFCTLAVAAALFAAPASRAWTATTPGLRGGRRRAPTRLHATDEAVPRVTIERPDPSTRRISASIVVERGVEDVWKILTDYDNLATHVPNLVQSYRTDSPTGGIRLFQEGGQKILGFQFGASLTMDMTEHFTALPAVPPLVVAADADADADDAAAAQSQPREISFSLVSSRFFSLFDGSWRLQPYGRSRTRGPDGVFSYTTRLLYTVEITPNGPVPIAPLEWRIREDVPTNLLAVKAATQALPRAKPRAKPAAAAAAAAAAPVPAPAPAVPVAAARQASPQPGPPLGPVAVARAAAASAAAGVRAASRLPRPPAWLPQPPPIVAALVPAALLPRRPDEPVAMAIPVEGPARARPRAAPADYASEETLETYFLRRDRGE